MGINHSQQSKQADHPALSQCEREGFNLILKPQGSLILEEWVKETNRFMAGINKQSRLFLPRIEKMTRVNLCVQEISYKFVYPNYPTNLKKQIMKRMDNNEQFTEAELWYILYRLLECSYEFQKHKKKSGDIRSQNVLLNSNGDMLLVNIFSFPNQKINYEKSMKNQQKTLLSPQQLWELQQNIEYPKVDPSTCQSFSIGLTIMDAALLQNSEELYNVKDKINFVFETYRDKISKLKTNKYSPFFIKTLLNLTEGKSSDRISPGQALAILSPYHSSIINLDDFVPDRIASRESLQRFQNYR